MTRPEAGSAETSGMVSPWRGTAPEVITAAVAVTAAALAGYAMAGWAGLTVVAIATAAAAMVLLRGLLPQLTPDAAKKAAEKPRSPALTGYSRRRFIVRSAVTSDNSYDTELRPVLEHLLAARLAERHGVNLYTDPDAARRLLCRSPRDAALWDWIGPVTRTGPATPADASPRGRPPSRKIPRHTLARLIDRLERL